MTAGHDTFLHSNAPWRLNAASRAARSVLVGAAGITAAWVGTSGTVALRTQLLWLVAGGASLIVGGLGMSRWLLLGMREVRVLQRDVLDLLDVRCVRPETTGSAAQFAAAGELSVCAPPGARHFHRTICALVHGKDVETRSAAAFTAAGLSRCGVCRP